MNAPQIAALTHSSTEQNKQKDCFTSFVHDTGNISGLKYSGGKLKIKNQK
jgi:hypothetical protein